MPRRCLLPVLAALATGLAQAGVVEVVFEQPERHADAGRGAEAEAVRQALTATLQDLGRDGLPASQTLTVTITDINLAGESRPRGPTGQEIRVLRGMADWPVIQLSYRLSEAGKTLASGSERLQDMGYMHRLPPASGDAYPYEQRLLSRWFAERFGPARH